MSILKQDPCTSAVALIPDSQLFEETAKRLSEKYSAEHTRKFLYGHFAFIFHDGLFQGVEDRPKYRRYQSRDRKKLPMPGTP